MNIAIANEFFPPYVTGGTEIFLQELASYLKSEGFKVIVITTEQGQRENNAFKIYKISSSPFHFSHRYQFHGLTIPWMFFNFGLRRTVRKIYEKEKIDIVHANNLFHLSLAPIQTKLPFVLDIHDYWPVCFSKDLYYCDKKHCSSASVLKCSYCISGKMSVPFFAPLFLPGLALEGFLRKRYLSNAKRVVCHSDFVKNKLDDYAAEVVPLPFFEEHVPPTGRIDKPHKDFRLLFAGRLERKKGAHLLLDIADVLKSKGIAYRIDVIGDGPLRADLDRADINMHAHGFVSTERKIEFFKKADCLLALSLWPEPFGIVALEAMAYHVPIIAIEGSGLAQLVNENKAGIVCEKEKVAESIIKLIKDTGFCKSIIRNEKSNIMKYNKDKIFQIYKKVFDDALDSG